MSAATAKDPIKALWLERLSSALRTALACTIVGCTTLYGPAKLRHLIAYPAFSYVTAILIVSDATLGDTLRGCWHALYATIQVMIPCILTLHVIGPARFTSGLAAVVVAISAFVVALPESTSLMAKRIAFGQTVIVYVGAVIHGAEAGVVMHPVHVASSTALGALASVLAMLVPFPRLAYFKVKRTCRLYVENASERLDLFVEALTSQNKQAATDLLSQAKFHSIRGVRHLQTIKDVQGGMVCEIPQIRKPDVEENLQDIEIPMRGMEIALASCPSFPVSMIDEGIKEVLLSMKGKLGLKLQKAKCLAPFDATTVPEAPKAEENYILAPKVSVLAPGDLPAFFFLYCMELFLKELTIGQNPECNSGNTNKSTEARDGSSKKDQEKSNLGKTWYSSTIKLPSMERWTFAIKCSLSLGFAVLFGLIFNKENAYWSGLTIAICFNTERQATFTVTNARGQGTAIGSVYGVLCCFIFQRIVDLRFLPLLPWVIFASFLRHSRMYGQAGGISAAIGASLILGRKNYGLPNEFAIARLVEASIGLICFIMVEILLQPTRAATLARAELAWSLMALRDCTDNISQFCSGQKSMLSSSIPALRRKQQEVKSRINNLEKFIVEAESEPNFWFLPFNGACYRKLLALLRRMECLLLFVVFEIETLLQVSDGLEMDCKELQEGVMNNYLNLLGRKVGISLKSLEELISINSLALLEKKKQKIHISHDVELGESSPSTVKDVVFRTLSPDEEEISEIESSILQYSKEEANKIEKHKGAQKLKSQLILCIYSLGFCISSLTKETREIEKEVKELIKWENPTSYHLNFS